VLEEKEWETLLLRREGRTLYVTLNRPRARNAMTLKMVSELEAVVDAVRDDRGLRTLVLRGAEGHFCAGADVKEVAAARMAPRKEGEEDPLVTTNRRFGSVATKVDSAPQAVLAVLEGAVMGGGLGLACVADVAIARSDARIRLPETGLGLPPAQIATFLVRRLGLSQARRLAVTGGELDGRQAQQIGLVHLVCDGAEALEAELARVLGQIDRCAPGAIALTKELMLQVGTVEHEALLDQCARSFAGAARGPEGVEGMMAFVQKRPPSWSEKKE
jgi:isohexenylglutaconyl-CoA hydratase